jgi:hypothetical protein
MAKPNAYDIDVISGQKFARYNGLSIFHSPKRRHDSACYSNSPAAR